MICAKCKIDKPETEFHKDTSKKTGLKSRCRECQSISKKIYYQANKNHIRKYRKAYYQINQKIINEHTKIYNQQNSEHIREYKKTYNNLYNKVNSSHIKTRKRIYNNIHSEKLKIVSKAYRLANPEKGRFHWRKRKALKLGVGHEPYSSNYIFERDGYICQICLCKINKRLKWPNPRCASIDHIQPLSKGGWDSPTNVQASHLRCNMGKHATNKGQLRLFG